jgi:uncharacterized metal-binding protein YceD (DUF177 family)
MKAPRAYAINFVGLKEGQHNFEYHLDKKFLENFENPLIEDFDVNVQLTFEKHVNLMELHFNWTGFLPTVCDLCSEDFLLPLGGSERLIAKIVYELPEDLDEPEVIYIQQGESSLNIALPMYEAIVLQIPLRRVHPSLETGETACNPEVTKFIADHEQVDENEKNLSNEVSSIWDELKKLK